MSVLMVPVSSDRVWSDRLHCMSGSTERRSSTDTEQVRLRGEPARTGRGLLDDTITTGTGRAVGRPLDRSYSYMRYLTIHTKGEHSSSRVASDNVL